MNTRLAVAAGTLSALLAACASLPSSTSGYAGEESRAIKALSGADVAAYLEGKGHGFAKPAELNGYPGPMHVMELRDRLALTPGQECATAALLESHKREVRALGREYVASEERLESLFSSKVATPDALKRAVEESARIQSLIRVAHLETHLRQTALLTPRQVLEYQRLRGYEGSAHPH